MKRDGCVKFFSNLKVDPLNELNISSYRLYLYHGFHQYLQYNYEQYWYRLLHRKKKGVSVNVKLGSERDMEV